MVKACTLFSTCARQPRGDGVAVINISGGEVALTCDLAHDVELRFPALARATNNALVSALPDYATPANPLDATSAALSDPHIYVKAMQALLGDPQVSLVAVSQDCPAGLSDEAARGCRKLAVATLEVSEAALKPIVFYSNVAGPLHPLTVEPLLGSRGPVLHGAKPALAAIRAFVDWHNRVPGVKQKVDHFSPDSGWRDRLSSGRALTEHEAKRFLAEHGIRVTRESLASSAVDAVKVGAGGG
ncbi:MAG: hypothetical protein WKG52_05350 [Variovorax sp.]